MSKSIVKKALQLTESDDEDQSKLAAKQPKLKGLHSEGHVSGKKISTLEEYRIKQNKKVDQNKMKQMEKLRSIRVDKKITDKILSNLSKTKGKTSQGNKQNTEKSFFTEDDFQRYVRSIV